MTTAVQELGRSRDRVICVLACKAIKTKRAIGALCERQLADDAYGLCRVLLASGNSS